MGISRLSTDRGPRVNHGQLRLIRGDEDEPPKGPPLVSIEIRLQVLGRDVGRFYLCSRDPRDIQDAMTVSPSVREAGKDAPSNAIAGKLEHAPGRAAELLQAYCANMLARKRSKNTVDAIRQLVTCMMREVGISEPADLTREAIVGWLDSKAAAWKGGTYNRNLVLLNGFTKWLSTRGEIDKNTLDGAERALDDGDEGARAATTDEARRLLRVAWTRQESDARSKGNRALYWLMLFAHGCRAGEPEKLRWEHVFLDEEVPFIAWTKEISKNRKRMEVPLTRELATLLAQHKKEISHAPEDPVFPISASRVTFRSDRDLAEIPRLDSRGRRFSPHSARKWFETQMVTAGVHARMVDRIMRHFNGVQARYFDPSLAEMKAAIDRLPRLWPAAMDIPWAENSEEVCLTNGTQMAEHVHARTGSHATSLPSTDPSKYHPPVLADRREGNAGEGNGLDATSRARPSIEVEAALHAAIMNPKMPRGGLINADSNEALADLLDALARLVRQEAQNGTGRRRSRKGQAG